MEEHRLTRKVILQCVQSAPESLFRCTHRAKPRREQTRMEEEIDHLGTARLVQEITRNLSSPDLLELNANSDQSSTCNLTNLCIKIFRIQYRDIDIQRKATRTTFQCMEYDLVWEASVSKPQVDCARYCMMKTDCARGSLHACIEQRFIRRLSVGRSACSANSQKNNFHQCFVFPNFYLSLDQNGLRSENCFLRSAKEF